jgi:hypothetical protein
MPARISGNALKLLAIVLAVLATAVSLWVGASAKDARASEEANRTVIADLTVSSETVAQITFPPYLPWYTAVPSPLPSVSAYVGVAGALGAGNVYNTGLNGFGTTPPGTAMLNTGECYFICFGAPGMMSHHSLAFGNDVNSPGGFPSYTHSGAPDDCNQLFDYCPGGVLNRVFGLTVKASPLPPPGNGFFVALDGHGNLGVLNNFYAGAAVVAGAGIGTPAPLPSFEPGSLVSNTGAGRGDVLLGSSGGGNHVTCDYGETTNGMLTCDQPVVASDGLTSTLAITLGGVSSGYTFDCLVTFSSGGCALLTNGEQESLFIGESSGNFNQGGFLFNGPSDIDLSSGAYANASCCTATHSQASRIQTTDNGNGVIFYYNSGLTVGATFAPTEVGGVNSSGTAWAVGGVQPNSVSAGGSGGYAPEAFPLGATAQHPQILSGSCTVTGPSGTCTFPNSFAFAGSTYTCTISAQGTTPVATSYQNTSDASITIHYSTSGTLPSATFSYICVR